MKRLRPCLGLLLAASLIPGSLAGPAIARGGGGGGGHGFGGGGGLHGGGETHGGGDGYHFGGEGDRGGGSWGSDHPGYQGSHPAYGPGSRPGWNGSNDRNSFNNDTINRNNNFYNRNYNGWNRGWANGGYWGSRPWGAGWYGARGPGWGGWGWWGASAAAWGVAGLATGAAITGLVNEAANAQSTVIMVPQTNYQLNYGSVEAVGSYGVSFNYGVGGGQQVMGAVNCQQGLLNGQIPQNVQQAQLLNAVCTVAYGGGS